MPPCIVDYTFETLLYDSMKSSVSHDLVEAITDRRQFDVLSVSDDVVEVTFDIRQERTGQDD